MRSLALCIGIASLALTACAEATNDTRATDSIDVLREQHDIPGLAVGYIQDCKTTETQVVGTVSDEMDRPVTMKTAFEAGSVTKPVYAHLVMGLVERDEIDLDAPLSESFDYPRMADQNAYRSLTLRQILSHRSGLPNWSGNSGNPKRNNPIKSLALPDETFHYSGEAYWMGEQYVEASTGKSFDDLFDNALADLMPLSTPVNAPKQGAETSWGKFKTGRSRQMSRRTESNAAFSLQTTIGDFSDYIAFMCAGGGLEPETLQEMFTPVTRVKGDEYGGDPSLMTGTIHYGLGWAILEQNGRRVYFHGGTTGAYEAFAAFDPVSKDGFVFLANSGHGLDLVEELAPESLGDLSSIEVWFN